MKPSVYIRDADFHPSSYYHGRWECVFYGRRGSEILRWIRNTFGDDDDMVYCINGVGKEDCRALITDEQLTMTLLRWPQ
jgi:hypothetical protein